MQFKGFVFSAIILYCVTFSLQNNVNACTGISLKSEDGSVVVARTVEWSLSDAQHNRIAIFPRNIEFAGMTPEGVNGKRWKGRYGFVSMTAYDQPYGPDISVR